MLFGKWTLFVAAATFAEQLSPPHSAGAAQVVHDVVDNVKHAVASNIDAVKTAVKTVEDAANAAVNTARRAVHLPVELKDSTFDHDTQIGTHNTAGAWFVKFYAPWCGHCRRMEGVWNDLANEVHGLVNIGSVDATQNTMLAERFKITGYPSLILFKDQKMFRYSGARSLDAFKKFLHDGGYLRTPDVVAEDIPKPLTRIDMLKAQLLAFGSDLEQVVSSRLNVAITLMIVGASIGFPLGALLTAFMTRRKGAVKKSTRKTD